MDFWQEAWATGGQSPAGRQLWLSDAVSGAMGTGGALVEHYFSGPVSATNYNPTQTLPPLVTVGPTRTTTGGPLPVAGQNTGMLLIYLGLAAVAAYLLIK